MVLGHGFISHSVRPGRDVRVCRRVHGSVGTRMCADAYTAQSGRVFVLMHTRGGRDARADASTV